MRVIRCSAATLAVAALGLFAACLLTIDDDALLLVARDAARDVDDLAMRCGPDGAVCEPTTSFCCTPTESVQDPKLGTCLLGEMEPDAACGYNFHCASQYDCARRGFPKPLCCAEIIDGGIAGTDCFAACADGAAILCNPNQLGTCAGDASCVASAAFPGMSECR